MKQILLLIVTLAVLAAIYFFAFDKVLPGDDKGDGPAIEQAGAGEGAHSAAGENLPEQGGATGAGETQGQAGAVGTSGTAASGVSAGTGGLPVTPEQERADRLRNIREGYLASSELLAFFDTGLQVVDDGGSPVELGAQARKEIVQGIDEIFEKGLLRNVKVGSDRFDEVEHAASAFNRAFQDGRIKLIYEEMSPEPGSGPLSETDLKDSDQVQVGWRVGSTRMRIQVERQKVEPRVWRAWAGYESPED